MVAPGTDLEASPLTLRIQTSAPEQADWSRWDELAAEAGLYSSAAWVRRAAGSSSSATIGTVLDQTRVVAMFCCSVITKREGLSFDPYRLLLTDNPVRRDVNNFEWSPEASPETIMLPLERDMSGDDPDCFLPMVVCGSTGERDNRLLIAPGLSEEQRVAVVHAIMGHLEEVASHQRAQTILLPYYPARDALLVHRARPDLLSIYTMVRHPLTVPSSFDEYLGSLKKESRRDARRRMGLYAERGFRTVRLAWADHVPRVRALLAEASKKYNGSIDVDRALAEMAAPEFEAVVFAALEGEQPIGVEQFLGLGREWAARVGGYHDASATTGCAYFNLLYYEPVRTAIAAGISQIDYAMGLTRMKVGCGTTASPRFFSMKIASPDLVSELVQHALPRARRALELLEALLARHHRALDEVVTAREVTRLQEGR
jgi:hypothetical protein